MRLNFLTRAGRGWPKRADAAAIERIGKGGDETAVVCDDSFYECEAKSGAAACFFESYKRLENSFTVRRWNAWAVIVDFNRRAN